MFKWSNKDFILVILALVQVTLLVLPFTIEMSTTSLIVLGFVGVFLIGTNYQCISHNFIHLPFFKHPSLNQIFSIINTIGIGIPQSAYKVHHLKHHRYNNRPEEDETSTFRFGKNGKEENIISYSVLGVFRTDVIGLTKESLKKSPLAFFESVFFLTFLITLLALNWKIFLGYLAPVYFSGMVFALWENYCEHHHANPYDRKRDSVSSYNPLYNFIWFNNGYHQEHHFSPQVHWTKISEVKSLLPEDRIIVKGCHLTNTF